MKKLYVILCFILVLNTVVFAEGESSLQIQTSAPGNIFFENETVSFAVSLQNSSLTAEDEAELAYEIKNEGRLYCRDSEKYESGMTIVLPEIPFGVYTFTAKIYLAEQVVAADEVEFSYVKTGKNEGFDGVFGICTHFAQNKGDIDISAELLKGSGVKWIRDECSWGNVEKKKGVYVIPEKTEYYVDKALSSGINTLMVLDYGNSLYDEGGAPYTPAGRRAFANYARAVAENFKGKIRAYEIWNEWSGGMGNPQNRSAAEYAELLKVVYPVLKSVDPNIQVIAGATHNEGTSWFREMLEAGAYDFFDAISYHPYCYPQNPDMKDYKGNVEDNYAVNSNLLKQYGGEKPIWLTEYGWHSGYADGNVSENLQAAYMARSYVCGAAYGIDKIFWYDFQNDGVDLSNREDSFGLIRCWQNTKNPYAAKPGYAALSAMTGILDGCEFVKEYRPIPSVRVYRFYRKADKKDVAVLYHAFSGSLEIGLEGKTAGMQAYDMFGNPCDVSCVSEEPIYLVGEGFNPQEIITTGRKGVSALLGISNCFDGLRGSYTGIADSPDDEVYAWSIGGESSASSIDFDVDDTFSLGEISSVQIEVTYYDKGRDSFCIEYEAGNQERFSVTEPVKLVNTTTWRKAVFNISDAYFANGLDGADFRLVLNDASSGKGVSFSQIRLTRLDGTAQNFAMARLSDVSRFDKMTVRCGDNSSKLVCTEKNGRTGWLTDIDNSYRFLYCDIEDTYMYGPQYHLKIEVDYFDEGEGKFAISYNLGSQTETVKLQNTKSWKTASFDIQAIDCRNVFNKLADFRISLWTPSMGVSSENICFGGVRVTDCDAADDFNLNFDAKSGEIIIDGYAQKSGGMVTVEILNLGKAETDLPNITYRNVSESIIYANMVKTDKDGYYRCKFNQSALTGKYLVRVRPAGSQTMSKFLNYFNCYDVVNIKFTDRDNKTVNTLSGLDYVKASVDFTSNLESMNVCMVLSVYDENNRLTAVDCNSFGVVKGVSRTIDMGVELDPELMSDGCRAKIFLLKGIDNITPVTEPVIL